MREKWARMSTKNDGEAHGRGQDSISKPGEEGRRGRVLRWMPAPAGPCQATPARVEHVARRAELKGMGPPAS